MPDQKALAADAKAFSARHGIDFGLLIRLGSAAVAAYLQLQAGQPVKETLTIHGEEYDFILQKHQP